jgi:hypothetical protein
MGLLLPVERCPAPSHEFSCLGRGLPGRPGLGDDAEFVLDHLEVAGWSSEAGAGGAGRGDAGVDPASR